MKRVSFENGKITQNILGVAMPMLVAQLISLLYNVIDRIYIARIPDVGTAALGGVGLCFPLPSAICLAVAVPLCSQSEEGWGMIKPQIP
jgi:Na+-driven multidrug efflux pump